MKKELIDLVNKARRDGQRHALRDVLQALETMLDEARTIISAETSAQSAYHQGLRAGCLWILAHEIVLPLMRRLDDEEAEPDAGT